MKLRDICLWLSGAFMLIMLVQSPSYAATFTGTILETITSTDNPAFSVVQTAMGTYGYESPTVDGDFGLCAFGIECTSGNVELTLFGSIQLFSTAINNNPFGFDSPGVFFPSTHLLVTNGHVTNFHIDGQDGAVDFNFDGFNFEIIEHLLFPPSNFITTGTLSFSDPVPTPEPSALILIATGLLGVSVVKRVRWKTNKNRSSYAMS